MILTGGLMFGEQNGHQVGTDILSGGYSEQDALEHIGRGMRHVEQERSGDDDFIDDEFEDDEETAETVERAAPAGVNPVREPQPKQAKQRGYTPPPNARFKFDAQPKPKQAAGQVPPHIEFAARQANLNDQQVAALAALPPDMAERALAGMAQQNQATQNNQQAAQSQQSQQSQQAQPAAGDFTVESLSQTLLDAGGFDEQTVNDLKPILEPLVNTANMAREAQQQAGMLFNLLVQQSAERVFNALDEVTFGRGDFEDVDPQQQKNRYFAYQNAQQILAAGQATSLKQALNIAARQVVSPSIPGQERQYGAQTRNRNGQFVSRSRAVTPRQVGSGYARSSGDGYTEGDAISRMEQEMARRGLLTAG